MVLTIKTIILLGGYDIGLLEFRGFLVSGLRSAGSFPEQRLVRKKIKYGSGILFFFFFFFLFGEREKGKKEGVFFFTSPFSENEERLIVGYISVVGLSYGTVNENNVAEVSY